MPCTGCCTDSAIGVAVGGCAVSSGMECCDCGGMLTFGGKLIVIDDEIEDVKKPKKKKKAVADEG